MASPPRSSSDLDHANLPTRSKNTSSIPNNADKSLLQPPTLTGASGLQPTLPTERPHTPPVTPTEPQRDDTRQTYFPSPSASGPHRPSLTVQTSGHCLKTTGIEIRRDDSSAGTHNDAGPNLEVFPFPHWISDYTLGEGKRRKLLGSGLWSDVYLATPAETATSSLPSQAQGVKTGIDTPPYTPVHSRGSSWTNYPANYSAPPAYAVKMPANSTAKEVLVQEARTLTQLSVSPKMSKYIVRFYGLDGRNDSLIMKAMDTTLEGWVKKHLNVLDEDARAKELSATFETLAGNLLDGLLWLGDKKCIHADIKPANILVTTSGQAKPQAVYSDFSSAVLEQDNEPERKEEASTKASAPQAPLGGGTWDFLDPVLLSTSQAGPPAPSPSTDLWALAVTLLYVIIGSSPFHCGGRNYGAGLIRRREFVKQGIPLECASSGDDGVRNWERLQRLGRELGWDVHGWLGRVFRRDPKRCMIEACAM